MFIVSLRGRFGTIIAVQLCLLSIALTVVLFSSSILGLQLAAVAAFVNGGVKAGHRGGAKVGQLSACALERVALI